MKKQKIFLIFSILSLLIVSCDKIDPPYTEAIQKPDTDKKVLLEDFTGHKCVNCPSAHEIAHQLQDAYGKENLVVVAIHAGFFAETSSEPFTYDFRTEAGTAYESFFQVQAYPSGMVDRVNTGGDYLIGKDGWSSQIAVQFEETPLLNIAIEPETTEDQVSGSIDLFFLQDITRQAYIQIWITEDSIVKPQVIPGGTDDVYVHMHALRGSLNGNWGSALPNSNYVENDQLTIDIPAYSFGNDWKIEHLSIVAFVYDEETKKVLQVEQKQLIE
jgi:thiol-disulfide isomerase/thioredoxin